MKFKFLPNTGELGKTNLPTIPINKEIKDFIDGNFKKPIKSNQCASQTNKKRIEFIDLAKGICILLVVLLHMGYTDGIPALKALRMPLYFILSGLFYKDYGSIVSFIIKKLNRILIPFCLFVVCGLGLTFLCNPSLEVLKNEIIRPFQEPDMVNIPIWFLLCLFEVNILYRVVYSAAKNIYLRASLVIIIGFIGYVLGSNQIYLPLFAGSACSALPFFFIGMIMRKLPILYASDKDWIYEGVCFTLLLCAIGYCVFFGTPRIDFRTNSYNGDLLSIYLVAISLVLGLLIVCKKIKWVPVISYLGRYSIIVLGFHRIIQSVVPGIITRLFGYDVSKVELLILTLFLCWIAIPICKRFIPYFTAQADLIRMREK